MISVRKAILATMIGTFCFGAWAQDPGQGERPRRARERIREHATSSTQWAGKATTATSARDRATQGIQTGSIIPEFTLPDSEGKSWSLSSSKGKIVVLEWTNPGCPFVQRHYKKGTFKQLAMKYADRDVVWMALDSTNSVTPESAAEWHKKNDLGYPILLDKDGTVGRQFAAKTTPHLFIIDKDGKLAYQGAIDDDPSGGNEKPRNYVDEALAKLTAGEKPDTTDTQPYGCSVKYAR